MGVHRRRTQQARSQRCQLLAIKLNTNLHTSSPWAWQQELFAKRCATLRKMRKMTLRQCSKWTTMMMPRTKKTYSAEVQCGGFLASCSSLQQRRNQFSASISACLHEPHQEQQQRSQAHVGHHQELDDPANFS